MNPLRQIYNLVSPKKHYFWGAVAGAVIGAVASKNQSDSANKAAGAAIIDQEKAASYLEKQGKTTEEIRLIMRDMAKYEDVFRDASDEVKNYIDNYKKFGDDYSQYATELGSYADKYADAGEVYENYTQKYQDIADKQGGYEDEYKDRVSAIDAQAADFKSQADTSQQRYEQEFIPVQDQIIDQATNGENIGRAKAIATADTAQAFDNQRQQVVRDQQRYGINPNSGRMEAINNDMATNEALATVGARNKAQRDEEDRSWSKLLTVNAMGDRTLQNAKNYDDSALRTTQQGVNTLGQGQQAIAMEQGAIQTGERSFGNQVNTLGREEGAIVNSMNATGRAVDMTGREVATLNNAQAIDQSAYGVVSDQARELDNISGNYGQIASGYNGQAQQNTNTANSYAQGASNTAQAVGGLVSGAIDDYNNSNQAIPEESEMGP